MKDCKYRFARPVLPPIEAWAPFFAEAYRDRWFSNFGPLSRRLELELHERYGAREGVCVLSSSATSGLAACLIARNLKGPVLVPAFTFPASLSAVLMAGAPPLIVDVDPETWMVSPAVLAQALQESRAQAAMVVSPFGLRQNFAEHMRICREHDALLIIDNAAGLGVRREIEEQPPDMLEVCSMHATKPFAIGEGGVIFANTACEERLRGALNFALTTHARPEGPRWGINGKIPEIGAAIGLAQLENFDSQLKARRHFVEAYVEILGAFTGLSYVKDPGRSPWQFFPALLPSSDRATRFVDHAAELGLEIRRYYRPSLSVWPGVELAHACPIAENLSGRMCCLPVYSDATVEERHTLSTLVQRALRSALA